MLKMKKYWHHLLQADVISFSVTRNCQKIQKFDENSSYWQRNSSHLLNNLGNFNEILGKMGLMIALTVTKNQGFTLSLEDTFFEKPQGDEGSGVQINPKSPKAKNYLSMKYVSKACILCLHCLSIFVFDLTTTP